VLHELDESLDRDKSVEQLDTKTVHEGLSDSGITASKFALGQLYWSGDKVQDVRQNYTRALEHFREAASEGHHGAMVALGNAFVTG
jgi:hypothetical protein